MSITHHPSESVLASFASGALDEGQSLVVAAHLSQCSACRSAVRHLETVAGVFLDDIEPAALDAKTSTDALERIGRDDTPTGNPSKRALRTADDLLSLYDVSRWRPIGRGIRMSTVGVDTGTDTRVFMLKALPGLQMPHHAHGGAEWTCVLQGAFEHEHGRYGPGDFDEADEQVEHHPVTEAGDVCICLVAMQGQLELKSGIGRLLQTFVRF